MTKETIEAVEVKEPSALQKTLKVLAYPVAAVTGGVYAHKHARNSLYDTLKSLGAFNYEISAHKSSGETLVRTTTNLKGKIRPGSIKYNDDVTTILKNRGFNNTIDYFRELHPNQQFETLVTAFSAASIALGVALTIADNRSIIDRFSKHRDTQPQR
jgi:hypothetical protein